MIGPERLRMACPVRIPPCTVAAERCWARGLLPHPHVHGLSQGHQHAHRLLSEVCIPCHVLLLCLPGPVDAGE